MNNVYIMIQGPQVSSKNGLVSDHQSDLVALVNDHCHDFKKIILSTWTNNFPNVERNYHASNFHVIRSEPPDTAPFTRSKHCPSRNVMYQALSCWAGLQVLKDDPDAAVIKVRTDQVWPDYNGLFKFARGIPLTEKKLYVRGFRRSVPFMFGDGLLIGSVETLSELFSKYINCASLYENTHYDMFFKYAEVVSDASNEKITCYPRSINLSKGLLSPPQMQLVCRIWRNNLGIIPYSLTDGMYWRNKIYAVDTNMEVTSECLVDKFLDDLMRSSNQRYFLACSLRIHCLKSEVQFVVAFGKFLQFIKVIQVRAYYFVYSLLRASRSIVFGK